MLSTKLPSKTCVCLQKHGYALTHRLWKASSYVKKIMENFSKIDYSFVSVQNFQVVLSSTLDLHVCLKESVLGTPSQSDLVLFLECRQSSLTNPSVILLQVQALTFSDNLQAVSIHCKHCWTQLHPLQSQQLFSHQVQ